VRPAVSTYFGERSPAVSKRFQLASHRSARRTGGCGACVWSQRARCVPAFRKAWTDPTPAKTMSPGC